MPDTHIRLWGLDQRKGQAPTALSIGIEEGGTLTDLKGKGLWMGDISPESFEETMITYLESMPDSIEITLQRLKQKIEERRSQIVSWRT